MDRSKGTKSRHLRAEVIFLSLSIAVAGTGTALCGDLYRWVDEAGQAHFSDQPPPGSGTRYKVQKDESASPEPEPGSRIPRPSPVRENRYRQIQDEFGPPEPDPNTAAARAGMPDLYWKEAYEKIRKANQGIPYRPLKPGTTPQEVYRLQVAQEREAFRNAGYDYDSVIRAVADDAKSGRIAISPDKIDVPLLVYLVLDRIRVHARGDGVDFLQYFKGETREAVRYLLDLAASRAAKRPPTRSVVLAPPPPASVPVGVQPPRVPKGFVAGVPPKVRPLAIVNPKFVREDDSPVYRLKKRLERKDYKGAEALLRQGDDPNRILRPAYSMTLLHLRAQAGDLEGVRFLVSRGAKVGVRDENGGTPLMSATSMRQRPVMEYLISRGASVHDRDKLESSALKLAVASGWKEGVELLIRHGAQAEGPMDATGRTLLDWAAANGYTDIAAILIDHGADVNGTVHARESVHLRKTPLRLAIENERFPAAELLLRRGANPRAPELAGKIAEFIRDGKIDAARFLIAHGGDPDAGDVQGTPLKAAIRTRRKDLVEALIERGARIDARDAAGWTPLMFAAVGGRDEIVRLLVTKGADPSKHNRAGETAAAIATEAGWPEIGRWLSAEAGRRGNRPASASAGVADPVEAELETERKLKEMVDRALPGDSRLSAEGRGYVAMMMLTGGVSASDVGKIRNDEELGVLLESLSTSGGRPPGNLLDDTDSAYASPESTWKKYRTALSNGDLEEALKCLTPPLARRHREMFGSFSRNDLAGLGAGMEEISRVSIEGNRARYRIYKMEHGTRVTYYVELIKLNGNWKVDQF